MRVKVERIVGDYFKNEGSQKFLISLLVVYSVFFVVYLLLGGYVVYIAGQKIKLDWLCLSLIVAFTVSGFRSIKTGTLVAKTFFGKPIQDLKSGFSFAPRLVYNFAPFPTKIGVIVIGGPREVPVERDPVTGRIIKFKTVSGPEGSMRSDEPMRIVSASYESARWDGMTENEFKARFPKDNALANQTTLDPLVIVKFEIHSASCFVQVVGTKIEDAIEPISQTTRTAMQDYCGRETPAYIIHYAGDKVRDHLLRSVEMLTADKDMVESIKAKDPNSLTPDEKACLKRRSWGVNILSVNIADMGLPFHVNAALADNRAAEIKRHTKIIDAQATKEEKILSGEGDAEAMEANLRAKARGQKALMQSLKLTGNKIYDGETSKAIAENVGNLNVNTDKTLSAVVGALTAGQSVLTGNNIPTPTAATAPTPTGSGTP